MSRLSGKSPPLELEGETVEILEAIASALDDFCRVVGTPEAIGVEVRLVRSGNPFSAPVEQGGKPRNLETVLIS